MANQSFRGYGAFDLITKTIKEGMTYANFTSELVYEAYKDLNNVHIAFLVFERYVLRRDTRVSLSMMITDFEGEITVDASASGGGDHILTRFDWGVSDDFLSALSGIARSLNLTSDDFI
jgi:hypothetical protein